MASHRHALWVLAFVAFIESSVFPIPPDALMTPDDNCPPRRRAFFNRGDCDGRVGRRAVCWATGSAQGRSN